MPRLQFAVDKMLGRLATWLRILGYDATYGSHLGGRTLVRHARAQERIVLTRDRRLLRERPCPPLLLIASDHFREQLRQVIEAYQLDPFTQLFARCARCNLPLSAISKEEVADRVPPYVAATQTQFVRARAAGASTGLPPISNACGRSLRAWASALLRHRTMHPRALHSAAIEFAQALV